jgi:triosephosphate isomerase
MKRAKQARNADQAIAQNWTSLQVGDFVDVIEPGGYTYTAYIEIMSQKSDIVWIRAWGFGTRHMLHERDGSQLHRREKPQASTWENWSGKDGPQNAPSAFIEIEAEEIMTTSTNSPSRRKPLIAGNWKMNMDHVQGTDLLQHLAEALSEAKHDADRVEVAVFPPFTTLSTVQALIQDDGLSLSSGGQDVSPFDSGAYTGDTSAQFLAKLGCKYVLVGHSERRTIHKETDEVLNAKVKAVYRHSIVPVLCVGEGLEIRQAGTHVGHTLAQLRAGVEGLTKKQASRLVVAYEPVWAIGTGEVAGAEDAQEMCAAIRAELGELFDTDVAAAARLLYGGSVKANNASAILKQPDVDGVLVGGASLDAAEFANIARFERQAAN